MRVEIHRPCSENWDGMIPSEKGKYCLSCKKNVIDLTAASDEELVRILQNRSEMICARLRKDQLGRELVPPHKVRAPRTRWIALLAAATLLSRFSRSQTLPENTMTVTQAHGKKTLPCSIKTVVDSATWEPLAFVAIHIPSENMPLHTDHEGKFRLPALPSSAVLEFSVTGYEKTGVSAEVLTRSDTVFLRQEIILLEEVKIEAPEHLMGDLVHTPLYGEGTPLTARQRLKHFFKHLFHFRRHSRAYSSP